MARPGHARWLLRLALLCACGAPSACSHDLDALRSERGKTAVRDASAGKGGGQSGAGGQGGSSGSGSDGSVPDASSADAGPPKGACEPCEALSDGADALGLRICCRGTTGDECGLTFADGSLCLPRMVPGQANPACSELRIAGMRLPGCCRPDGRCGVVADGLGLGCVAREDVVVGLGGTAPEPVLCEYSCQTDDDCDGVLGGYVCAESPDQSRRFCAKACQRDRDCPKAKICGLSNDVAQDRVLAICRDPIGDVQPGGFCSAAEDCVHGVCTRVGSGDPFCTELCRNDGDCTQSDDGCAQSAIPTPGMGSKQNFNICLP